VQFVCNSTKKTEVNKRYRREHTLLTYLTYYCVLLHFMSDFQYKMKIFWVPISQAKMLPHVCGWKKRPSHRDGSNAWVSRGLCTARCSSTGKFGERLTKQRHPLSLIKIFLGNPCRICGGYTDTGSGFSPSISFLSCKIFLSTVLHTSLLLDGGAVLTKFLPSHENKELISQHKTYHCRKCYSVPNFSSFSRIIPRK